jgi:ISXO2 transposase-like protein
VRLKLSRVEGFSIKALSSFARRCLGPGSTVVSDGLQCFAGVTDAGCTHQPMATGGGPAAARKPVFKWVNTALGNIKAAMVGTYRSVNRSTCLAAWRNFSIVSTDAMISRQCCHGCAGPAHGRRRCPIGC